MRNFRFLIALFFVVSLPVLSQQNDWKRLSQLGKAFYEKGEFESAYQALAKARETAPADANLDAFLAQAAYRAGKFQEAAEAYKRQTEKQPDTWSNYNQGNAQFKNQDLNGAIQAYKEALRKDPNNEVARHNLAQALKKQEQQNQQNQQNQDKNNQDKNQQNQDQQQNQDKNDKSDKNENQDKNNQQQQQPKMGKEQTEQLLESMMQADKKAQEKVKDKEKKGVGSGKREKDW